MKCDEAISMEITLLTELADLIPDRPSRDFFGMSFGMIAAQVHVLAYRLNSDQVHDRYMLTTGDGVFLAILNASDWLYDMASSSKDHAPSVKWLGVLKYRPDIEDMDERFMFASEPKSAFHTFLD